jgi:ligand-binding sensor domain-containing protein/signal transduction histidine kinase
LWGAGFRVVALGLDLKEPAAHYLLDSWTTENGLPQNSINDILQTRDGYLWLATHGGLVRFDGIRFVVFDRSIEGIKSQRIKALYEDSKGTLWAATDDGMLIGYRDGTFTTHTVKLESPYPEALRIEEDDEGNLWITWRAVLTKFDGERFVNYRPADFVDRVGGILLGSKQVWWSQDSAGLHCFVKGRAQTYSYQDNLPKAQIIDVSIDLSGNLWIQTKGGGVVKAQNGQIKLHIRRESLTSKNVQGVFLEDHKNNLWFAQHSGNLYRIVAGKYELMRTFPDFSLEVIYEDREGSLWIGTNDAIHRLRELTITLLTHRERDSLDRVYSILQDRGGAIWIGTWGGGVIKYERGRLTRYRRKDGLPTDRITCIYEDHSGKLWVGTWEFDTTGKVSYFENGRFKTYDDEHGFLKRSVWAIHQDRTGNHWFGTDQGLVKLKDGNFTQYTTKDGLPYNIIRSLFEDRTGVLWIGTDQGLARLKDGALTTYTERDGFIGNQVRALYEDDDGVLWVGTYDGGLYRFKDERLTRYTKRDGLHDNGVFQILEDDAGNFWMGCNRGIYRVSRRELNDYAEGRAQAITSVVYGTKDGLATLECNGGRQPSGLKTKDGRLWFPTMGGVAVIDPNALPINTLAPPVIIEEFRLDNAAINFQGGVEMGPDKDRFEIRYTAPSFIKPEHIKFKYRLIGLDDDWIEASDRRTASYNRVPPGQYQFVVIAANSDGVWNTEGARIDIVVFPPFWQRWWFITLASTALASLLFLIYQRRVRHLQRVHALQAAFSQKLIQSQEAERKRIADDLHGSLAQELLILKNDALIGATLAQDGSPQRGKFDEISEKLSKTLEGVREIAHDLRPYHLDRLGLREAIEFMLERVGGSCAIRFSANIAALDGFLSKEAEMNLYRIVEEAVNNIIKHSGATVATLTLKRDGPRVQLTIVDNGKGFITDPTSDSGSPVHGFGLTGISERARMLRAEELIQSAPGHGTRITITMMQKGK